MSTAEVQTYKRLRARFRTSRQLGFITPVLTLEVAESPTQQAQGLMHRDGLAHDAGMLFIFAKPSFYGFWMKNTRIPLDLAWLSQAGIVQEARALSPHDETLNKPVRAAPYAVELPAGTFRKYDVRVGDRLVIL